MIIINSYSTAVFLCIITMICWGSWANTMKLTGKNWLFQLYYWDYSLGVLVFALLFAFTLGSFGSHGRPFLADVAQAETRSILYAIASGAVFNLANVLLVAVIDFAGMAIAFPIGIGLALVLGVIFGYIAQPVGNPVLIFAGLACVVLAIILDGIAYSKIPSEGQKSKSKGIILSVLTGIFMGFFYPILVSSISTNWIDPEPGKLTPYTAIVFFALGLLVSSFVWNYYFMRKPLSGPAVRFADYFTKGNARIHFVGLLGGIIWCTGFALMTLSGDKAGPAISYGLGQGATMVAVFWGVFVWREFKTAPKETNRLLATMFFFYLLGLTLLIVAKVR
ncbi:MAG: multidrug DMT transporter permease [Bacteroidetes bacterium]|nr:MAG: multidrug DMT transporter permease [Bacteroidota bacterium]